MEIKHTPGPWQVIEGANVYTAHGADSGDGIKADADDGWLIADCGSGLTYVDGELISLGYELAKANAKLISAAPDLLAALAKCLSLKGTLEQHGLFEEVEAALTKATT
jgi:hypothetical protein